MLGNVSGKDAQREAALSRTSFKYSFEKVVKNIRHTITKKYSPAAALTLLYKAAIDCPLEAVNQPRDNVRNTMEQKPGGMKWKGEMFNT